MTVPDVAAASTKAAPTKKALRCLKRSIAREIYHQLPRHHLPLDNP